MEQTAEYVLSKSPGSINGNITYVLSLGKYGVELFFAISGYLLYSIYCVNARKKISVREYFDRRAARILPLWLIFLLLHTILNYFVKNDNPNLHFSSLRSQITASLISAIFLSWIRTDIWNQVLPGDWSIHAEVFHYAVFLFFLKGKSKKLLNYYLAICILTILIGFTYNAGLLNHQLNLKTAFQSWMRLDVFSTLFYFLLGIMIGKVMPYAKKIARMTEFKQEILDLGLVKLILLIICLPFLPLNFGTNVECFGFLVIALSLSIGLSHSAKLSKALMVLGKYSYFLYFFHFIALDFIRMYLNSENRLIYSNSQFAHPLTVALLLSLVLLIAIPIGALSYRYIETPILRFSKK